MGGIIDFNTTCPWEIYLFAFCHIGGALALYFLDFCNLLLSTPCTDAEQVFARIVALSMLYVGVVYTVLTYHNKENADKITRLSDFAMQCSVAMLVSVIFVGNASMGGLEKSWMHMGDMLTMIILVGVLGARVSKANAEWAQVGNPHDNLGVNCKTLLILFNIGAAIKFLVFTDFLDPTKMLADGSEMTDMAAWLWKFTAVLIFEWFLAILYTVLFDDGAAQELLVIVIMVMSIIAALSIGSVQPYMGTWMGLNNSSGMWIKVGILLLFCIVAIVGGRRGGSTDRTGYSSV